MDKLHSRAIDYFKFSMDEYEGSRVEAKEIRDFNHNKHYTIAQLNTLRNRKQPEETFNVIKAYKRVLSGYLSSTINNISVKATKPQYTTNATVGNDIVQYVLRDNKFDTFRTLIQEELILSGLCGYETRAVTKGVDQFGTPDIDIQFSFLQENELAVDPLYRNPDYSDARFVHKFRWVPEEIVNKVYPNKLENINYINNDINTFNTDKLYFNGRYKTYNNYLLITTQLRDDNDDIYELIWCDTILLEKRKIPQFTIKPFTMEKTEDAEYYGLFREVIESQKAINQALIQIQLLVNTNKVFVQDNMVRDIETFKRQYDRVNAVIQVKDLNGFKVENMSGDVVDQYNIIANSLDRIKQVLNLNDSFLGMAGSSASGRQVKLQQNMTASALQYLTTKLNAIYISLATDILELSKKYFKANKVFRITDKMSGDKYVELNKPVTILGKVQYKDELKFTEDGVAVLEPWFYKETTLDDLDYEVEITTSNYNETDDMERMQLDSIVQGPAGQMLLNTNPAGFAKVVELQLKGMRTRNSEYIAQIFEETAQKLSGAPTQDPRQFQGAQGSQGANQVPAMMSAAGMSNDSAPDGYNAKKG